MSWRVSPVQDVIRQGGWLAEPLEFGHYRTHAQSEVDLVIETYDGRVATVEVKASARLGTRTCEGYSNCGPSSASTSREALFSTPEPAHTPRMTGSISCPWTGSGRRSRRPLKGW